MRIAALWTGLCCVGLAGCSPPSAEPPIPPPDPDLSGGSVLYGGDGTEEMEGLIATAGGGSLVVGWTDSFEDEDGDAWLLALDDEGAIDWQRTYGGPDADMAIDARQTEDGGFVVAGWTESGGAGETDAWLMKLDGDGAVVWERTYGGPGTEQFWSVVPTRDGAYVLAGGTTSFGAGKADYWVVKVDSGGDILWQETLGGPEDDGGGDPYAEFVVRAIEDRDGNLVIGSESASFGAGATDLWLVKLNPEGGVIWQETYGGTDEDSMWSFAEAADGGYLVPGVTTSFSPDGGGDLWMLRLEPDGSVRWQNLYGVADLFDEAINLAPTADGGALIGGTIYLDDDWDPEVLRLSATGELQWSTRFERGWDWPNALVELPDGGALVAAVAWGGDPDPDTMDLWMLEMDSDGRHCAEESDLSLRVLPTSATITDTHVVPLPTDAEVGSLGVVGRSSDIAPRPLCDAYTR